MQTRVAVSQIFARPQNIDFVTLLNNSFNNIGTTVYFFTDIVVFRYKIQIWPVSSVVLFVVTFEQ